MAASTLTAGRLTFERQIDGEIEDLFAAGSGSQSAAITETGVLGLPEPVQRWLRYAGVVGAERPTAVRLKYDGEFRLGEDKGWMPYESQTYYTTDPPAFLWSAEMRMFPLVSVIGRDRYVDGEGSIRMKLLGLIPVADKRGGNLNQGALLRYLSEMVWFPAAVTSSYISWETMDPNAAQATMSYGGVTASATFTFDEVGRPLRLVAQRYNDSRGTLESWTIPIAAYGEFNGVRVPTEGEGIWNYDTGDFAYIRWHLTDLEYNRPERY